MNKIREVWTYIQNPVKYLRWIVLRKKLTAKSHYLFSQYALS